MNSIDNMRKYVLNAPSICSTTRAILVGYVDSIENEVDDMWHALTIDAKPMTDENMAEDGWIRLPKDADGEYIHVGDWITGKWDAKAKVVAITSEDVYWWEPDGCHWCHAYEVRHHRAPTVEDVLREFVERLDEIGSEDDCMGEAEQECRACIRRDIAAAYAEYAAKLRLAGEDA